RRLASQTGNRLGRFLYSREGFTVFSLSLSAREVGSGASLLVASLMIDIKAVIRAGGAGAAAAEPAVCTNKIITGSDTNVRTKRRTRLVSLVALVIVIIPMLGANKLRATNGVTKNSQHVLYRTVEVDGLSIFYREAGPKAAPTILLLHGLPSSSRMFEPLFARLSDRFHLVAPDYPGFGHSDC